MAQVFNAKEIEELKIRCDSVFQSTIQNINAIKDDCLKMSGIVASEDSKLGSVWEGVSNNMAEPINMINGTYDTTTASLNNYVQETLQNEAQAENKVSDLGADLDALNEASNNLTGGAAPGTNSLSDSAHYAQASRPTPHSSAEIAAIQWAQLSAVDQQQSLVDDIAADTQKSGMERWKILQDTQTKIFEIQQDVTVNKAKTTDKMFNKWDEFIRS